MKKLIHALALLVLLVSPQVANTYNDISAVVQKTLPTVVYIEVTPYPSEIEPAKAKKFWANNPSMIATGFVIDKNYIVTNFHVIEEITKEGADVEVYFYQGSDKKYKAKLIGYDAVVDIALLQISGVHPSACLCATTELKLGQPVFTISNFLGIEFSVTSGMVSSLDRKDRRFPYIKQVQLQSVQGSGSSGGPVFDENGKVVSVNQSILSMIPGASNGNGMLSTVSFSIRADIVNDSIVRIKRDGVVKRADLGIAMEPFTVESPLYRYIETKKRIEGVLVLNVDDETSKFMVGDVILSINDRKFTDPVKLLQHLDATTKIGQQVRASVYRRNSVIYINVPVIVATR
jgi:S1-C subfamily serine protease